jgi:hypothetical protein
MSQGPSPDGSDLKNNFSLLLVMIGYKKDQFFSGALP